MKARKSLLAVLSGSLLATLIVGITIWRVKGGQSPTINHATQQSEINVPAMHFNRGEAIEYDLSFFGQSPGSAHSFTLSGPLRMIILDEESDGFRVALSLQPDRTEGFEALDAAYRNALLSSFKEPVEAKLNRYGFDLVLNAHSLPDGPALEFWQGLTDRTRVRLPWRIPSSEFDQVESYFQDKATAHYEIDRDEMKDVSKQNQIYMQKSLENPSDSKRHVSGESLIVMRPLFDGVAQVEFKSLETISAFSLSSENTVNLRFVRQLKIEDQALSAVEQRMKSPRSMQEAVKDSIQAQVLGSMNFQDVWAKLQKESNQESYLLTKAWIQLHPKELSALLTNLRNLPSDDPKLRAAIKALTAVGSSEAQDVMVQLLKERMNDTETAQRIVSSLGFVTAPSKGAESALNNLVRSSEFPEAGRRAELALGIMGNTLNKSSDAESQARAAALEKDAVGRIATSKSSQETVRTLGMLGNLGPIDRKSIAAYLQSTDPEIRGEAFFALRGSPEKDTPQFLGEAFASEPAANVRKQILQALSMRSGDEPLIAAINSVLSRDISEEDRLLMAQTLTKNASVNPDECLRILGLLKLKGGSEGYTQTLGQYQDLAKKNATF